MPTFRRQIEAGGPVTVTQPEITRYFMTIPEAVSLTLQAASMARGYGVYVLEMGRPVRIADLAHRMIELTGAQGVEVEYTGLRPGEKLREELFEPSESWEDTDHPMIFRLEPNGGPRREEFMERLERMLGCAENEKPEEALEILRALVPSYGASAQRF